jgi:hypothetical protein
MNGFWTTNLSYAEFPDVSAQLWTAMNFYRHSKNPRLLIQDSFYGA